MAEVNLRSKHALRFNLPYISFNARGYCHRKGVGHIGHDEAMEAGGREFSLHGRVVKGVGHIGHDEAMEAGGRELVG